MLSGKVSQPQKDNRTAEQCSKFIQGRQSQNEKDLIWYKEGKMTIRLPPRLDFYQVKHNEQPGARKFTVLARV